MNEKRRMSWAYMKKQVLVRNKKAPVINAKASICG